MKPRILIIDDEADFCGIVRNHFLKKDYDAVAAHTMEEGWALIGQFRPDILFLDNNLPDGNGWEIVDKVVELIPQIRIYLISAHRDKESYQGNSSNIMIWEKPVSLSQLNITLD